MPLPERRRRAEGLRRAVEEDDVAAWFRRQLADIVRYADRNERNRPTAPGGDGSLARPIGHRRTAETVATGTGS